MKATIFTETGPQVGFGHLSRCISLAQALSEIKFEINFVLSGRIPENFEIIDEFPLKYVDWITELSEISVNINESGIGIFDSYKIEKKHIDFIDNTFLMPIFIDDMNLVEYNKGIVINSSFSASKLNYIKKPTIQYFFGPLYTMLKREFWNHHKKNQNINIHNVLVTLGANDNWNLTPNIISSIQNYDPNLIITTVVTSHFQNINRIKKYENSKCNTILDPNTIKMRELMLNSDIAITAGGQTCVELLSMQVPSIVIVTAENQQKNAEIMDELNVALYSGAWKDPDLFKTIDHNLSKIQSHQTRQTLINNSNKYIKSDGCKTLVKRIIKIYDQTR